MRERILEDLKSAMKNQEKEILSVIRMVKGAISLEEINLKRELNDDEIIGIIAKQIKTRKESIIEFEKGNRKDLIDKTTSEIEKEISQNGYAVYVTNQKFYQKTDFIVCACAVLIGVLIITLLYLFTRKKLIKAYDENEKPFYRID